MLKISKLVSSRFEDYVFDWNYETYLLVGGYGSGKSYHTAFKIILKLLEEMRTCLVLREVGDTHGESTFSLFKEILEDMKLLMDDSYKWKRDKEGKVLVSSSPMSFRFKNGSRIIFKGMDKPEKLKSINGVSIVWFEEATEIKYEGYKEVLGRVRTPDQSMHFILTCNPVSKSNWVYRHFFSSLDDNGNEHVIVSDSKFYNQKCLVKNGVYYHHSTADDNPWLPWRYILRLDKIKDYDPYLYMVARWGHFGTMGTRVLPQFTIQTDTKSIARRVKDMGYQNMYFGFDFGFEESYNAVVCMSVDMERKYLYIWDEVYMNHVTDPEFAALPEMQRIKRRILKCREEGYMKFLVADNEDPKAIAYYKQMGYPIRKCRNKFAGSRLSNTRKIKRFKKVIVSPKCKNTIRELKDLTYKKAPNGDLIHDQFNIDPHTFSAIWYGLDTLTVADYKDREYWSRNGSTFKNY